MIDLSALTMPGTVALPRAPMAVAGMTSDFALAFAELARPAPVVAPVVAPAVSTALPPAAPTVAAPTAAMPIETLEVTAPVDMPVPASTSPVAAIRQDVAAPGKALPSPAPMPASVVVRPRLHRPSSSTSTRQSAEPAIQPDTPPVVASVPRRAARLADSGVPAAVVRAETADVPTVDRPEADETVRTRYGRGSSAGRDGRGSPAGRTGPATDADRRGSRPRCTDPAARRAG